ncbi:MAG: DMT family transporter [Spirochaetales bacterium]|nr:DMT family transporter [Spirochaetales bacterium]
MILGGSSIIPAKFLAGSMPLFSIHFLSLLFAAPVMVPFVLASGFSLKKINRREFLCILLQALSGVVLFRIAMVQGLKCLSAFSAGVITSLSPLVLSFLSILLFRERPGYRFVITLLMVVCGLFFLNSSGDHTGSIKPFQGFLWILLSVFAEAGLSIFRKKSVHQTPAIMNTFLIILISIVFFFPFFLLELFAGPGIQLSFMSGVALLHYGIIATGLAYICWGAAAIKLSGCNIGIYTAFMPLSATFFSVVILGEKPLTVQFLGAAVTFAGVLYFILTKKRPVTKTKKNKLA